MNEDRLFGTDGIRGIYGKYPLDPETVTILGISVGEFIKNKKLKQEVIIGGDTRPSTYNVFRNLAIGLKYNGIESLWIGTAPTPVLSYLAKLLQTTSIAISASHNPPEYNGLKFFKPNGEKWDDIWEKNFESTFYETKTKKIPTASYNPLLKEQLVEKYIGEIIKQFVNLKENTTKYLIDLANGAAVVTVPRVLQQLQIDYEAYNYSDGSKINVACGATNPNFIATLSKTRQLQAIAFDGDADRVILSTEKGKVIDGDLAIYIIAKWLSNSPTNLVTNKKIVITQMSNLALEENLKRLGFEVVRSQVGDQEVYSTMKKVGAEIGGEQAGHIIFSKYLPTGDGLFTALVLHKIATTFSRRWSEFTEDYSPKPQKLINIKVPTKIPLTNDPFASILSRYRKMVENNGRIYVRYSGTEPLMRILVEGELEVDKIAKDLALELTNCFREVAK